MAMTYLDDAFRWAAVEARDPLADGRFVYAVKTTKVFCRPICKARLARRANVSFFETAELARDAGFRACKRCRPLGTGRMPEDAAVQKVRAFVGARAEKLSTTHDEHDEHDAHDAHGKRELVRRAGRMSLGEMARTTGLSKWHFYRVFKRCVGMTPAAYLEAESQEALHRATMMGLAADVQAYGDWLRQQGVEGWGLTLSEDSSSSSSSSSSSPGLLSLDDVLSWPGGMTDELPA
ncbi:Bifunctional transcriptional activator/DNA repair enzyme Ada [Escovopsis weberi]|uniref:Bifunctional transcriptional activator/DNA repair enzyme Ada n=1 Tax=Escovopsis weberi TaxID=150374 RepID=A0A0M8N217_ESCWE|nr:Bifunctional transcriptional activator/DNA repair enzyme Ada [Escovopsis weberi]